MSTIYCPYCGHDDILLGRSDDLCRESEQREGYCPKCMKSLQISYIQKFESDRYGLNISDDDIVTESHTIKRFYPIFRIENIVKTLDPITYRIKTWNSIYEISSITWFDEK